MRKASDTVLEGWKRNYKDYVCNKYGLSAIDVPTSWKIRSIHSPTTGRTVRFEYTSPVHETQCYRETDAVMMLDKVTGQFMFTFPAIFTAEGQGAGHHYKFNHNYSPGSSEPTVEEVSSGSFNLPAEYSFPMVVNRSIVQQSSYVSKIIFSGGSVLFTCHEGGKKGLTSIKIYDRTNTLVRRIEFDQITRGMSSTTLILQMVRIVSPSGAESEQYSFQYNDFILDKNTRSIDRWGYYNGADNSSLVPTIRTEALLNNYPLALDRIVPIVIPGGDREPNEMAMQAGMLKSITFPTGGESEFIYEAHRYKDDDGDTRLAGGLRIKQIRDVESSGRVRYRNFRYSTSVSTINGSGVLNVIPVVGVDLHNNIDTSGLYYREVECNLYSGSIPSLSAVFKERIWTDNTMVNLFSENGSSVSYPYVIETTSTDPSGTNISGQKLHHYNVSSSRPMKIGNTDIVADSKDDWRKGNLLSSTVTKDSGDSAQPVLKTEYNYNLDYGYGYTDSRITQGYVFKSARVYGINEDYAPEQHRRIAFFRTDLSNGRMLPESRKDKSFESNGSTEQTSSYSHDAYGNVSRSIRNTSLPDGERRTIVSLYAQDMVGQGRDPTGIYAEMVSRNMVGIPVETKEYRNDVTDENLLTTLSTSYAKFNGSLIAPKETVLTIKDGTDGPRKQLFNFYDCRGNILEREDSDGTKEVYLWGYHGQHPVAMIVGSDWNSVKSKVDTSILNTGTESQIRQQLESLRNEYANDNGVQVSTYLYKPLIGLSSETDVSGRTTYYEYDGLGRLKRTYMKENGAERTVQMFQYHYKQ